MGGSCKLQIKERMTELKVEIVSKKLIRPSSPTSHHHKNFKLSLFEQSFPPNIRAEMIFFYSASNSSNHMVSKSLLSHQLQKSLSKTLVHYYPFAGRLNGASIDCNDEGAYFVEAQINCHLSNFLSQIPGPNLLCQFISSSFTKLEALDVLLHVQVSVFNCGGVAIGVSLSHKIADASSLFTFVQSWTMAARNEYVEHVHHDHQILLPEFINTGPLMPPVSPLPTSTSNGLIIIPAQNFTTRRFVFRASKMTSLKAKTSRLLLNQQPGTNGPTRVELVSAIVLKCAINAVAAAASQSISSSTPALLSQAINLRKRMVPRLPDNALGNLVGRFHVLVEKNDIELSELVVEMSKGFMDFCNYDKAKTFQSEDCFSVLSESLRKRTELREKGLNYEFWCSSLCGFPLYDMDFGWGKPIWVTCPSHFDKFILLVDTKWGEDIEAWVNLQEKEMAIFERDEMLLSFASLNPSAIASQCRM